MKVEKRPGYFAKKDMVLSKTKRNRKREERKRVRERMEKENQFVKHSKEVRRTISRESGIKLKRKNGH